MRVLFEVETARLAATRRTRDQLESFRRLLQKEAVVDHENATRISELDFDFHHLLALSSGNHIYPLLLNSFKQCYLNLTGRFFSDPSVVPKVFTFHKEMVLSLEDKNEKQAVKIMERMLTHGAEQLKNSSGRKTQS